MTHYVGDDCPGGHKETPITVMPDWTELLTEEEREIKALAEADPKGIISTDLKWADTSREAVPALLRTVAALRALVEECREALRASHEHIQQSEAVNSYNRRGRDAAQLQRMNTSLLALTEADMRKRLEAK